MNSCLTKVEEHGPKSFGQNANHQLQRHKNERAPAGHVGVDIGDTSKEAAVNKFFIKIVRAIDRCHIKAFVGVLRVRGPEMDPPSKLEGVA